MSHGVRAPRGVVRYDAGPSPKISIMLAIPVCLSALLALLQDGQTADQAWPDPLRPGSSDPAGQSAVGVQEVYDPAVQSASNEGLESLATMRAAEGIEVELWAAEPMVANPVCLYVANSGEVYVAETFRHHAGVTDIREHMDWLDDDLAATSVEERAEYFQRQEGEAYGEYAVEHERIRLIRDTDGDGQADEAIVFADGFNDPMAGIGAGLLEDDGHVYYTCIPDLWRLTDTDGDGVADQRLRLSTGYGVNVALLGHDLHGLRIGPDGRLYFSSGDRGFQVETESGVLEHHHTGAVLRCDLDGRNLEVFATGLRNPQELVFDEFGNLWTGDNNSDGGDKARWVYVVEGMDAGWRYGWQWITQPNLRGPWNDEQLWHPFHPGQAAYIVPPVANLASGPSGLTYYPGTGLSDDYAGHFFLCDFLGDPGHSGVHTFTVARRGAGFELGPVEWFLENTLVTDADFGPDGRLWFTDWVFGWNKTGKGRVYRAFDPEALDSRLVRQTRELLSEGVAGRPPEELEDLLAHPDQRVRQLAQFELVAQALADVAVEQQLADIAFDTERPRMARLHAIWALDIVHRERPSSVADPTPLLRDPDVEVRAQTVRVLADSGAAREALIECLGDESARVQSLAAIALGRRGEGAARAELWGLLEASAEDPVLRHAAIMGLVGTSKVHELGQGIESPLPHVRIGTVVALRRKYQLGQPVAALLQNLLEEHEQEDPLVLLETARAVYDEGIERCYPELAALTERAHELPYPLVRRALNAHLRLREPRNATALAEVSLREDVDPRLRVEALHLLSIWNEPPGRDYVTGEWRPLPVRSDEFVPWMVTRLATSGGLAEDGPALASISDAPAEVFKKWIAVAMQVAPEENAQQLADWALDRGRPVTIRAACLRALRDTDDPAVLNRLREAFFDQDAEVRAAALVALRRVAPGEILPLVETVLSRGSTPERRAAYQSLADLDDERVGLLLAAEIEKLEGELIPDELTLDLILAVEARQDAQLDARLEARALRRSADAALAPWLDSLWGGDAERGEQLFREHATLTCLRCHQIDADRPSSGQATANPGTPVGPSLIGVGQRLTRLDLARAIVEPNRQIAAGYETESFFFLAGGHVAGRVLAETEDAITVIDSAGETHVFAPDELEVRRSALSAMPANLIDSMTREDLRDLVEFLGSL